MSVRARSGRSRAAALPVGVLLTATLLLAAYTVTRYGGLFGETDTNAFARAIRAMLIDSRLAPSEHAYEHGYAFPALAAFLVRLTGVSVVYLQILGGPLLAVWVIIPAWLAYRELTGSPRGATVSTVFILVQPEFLFPILRGTHEKFTRGLMFMCVFLLVRSIAARQNWRRFAALLVAFYLASYALITFNNLMAISFIVALGVALVGSWALPRLKWSHSYQGAATRRLLYAAGISLVLAFLFTFYAYPPARRSFLTLRSTADRLTALFLDVEAVATNPYQTIITAWVSLPIYFLVSIANWLLLGTSFVLWAAQTLTWWRRPGWPEEPRAILLWSLYGAFGFLGALSIAVDVSGAIASNMQHRIFPSFAMIAAALVADRFVSWRPPRGAFRVLAHGVLTAAIAFLGVVGVAKATNEPLVSNKWAYYRPPEFAAIGWSRRRYPDAPTWTAFDERLRSAVGIRTAWSDEVVELDAWDLDPGTRNILLSDVVRARGQRLDLRLPIEGDSLRVYDNGGAEVYHLRPRTPFQK